MAAHNELEHLALLAPVYRLSELFRYPVLVVASHEAKRHDIKVRIIQQAREILGRAMVDIGEP